jgi:hypothetical protein
VFDALAYALAELDDPLVEELALASVVPAPSSARVLVTLVATRDDIDPDVALGRVREHADELREEGAAEVTRNVRPSWCSGSDAETSSNDTARPGANRAGHFICESQPQVSAADICSRDRGGNVRLPVPHVSTEAASMSDQRYRRSSLAI